LARAWAKKFWKKLRPPVGLTRKELFSFRAVRYKEWKLTAPEKEIDELAEQGRLDAISYSHGGGSRRQPPRRNRVPGNGGSTSARLESPAAAGPPPGGPVADGLGVVAGQSELADNGLNTAQHLLAAITLEKSRAKEGAFSSQRRDDLNRSALHDWQRRSSSVVGARGSLYVPRNFSCVIDLCHIACGS
jgi:hypothetical protein